MAFDFEREQKFTVQATLAATDASKVLRAGVAGETIVVTSVILTSITAAAQVLYVGDEAGTVKALSLPASKPDAGNQASLQLVNGLAITAGDDLIIKPAAAGPSVHVVAEGYIRRA